MIKAKDIDLKGAYKKGSFSVPITRGAYLLTFNVLLKGTYVSSYTLDLMFLDDEDEEVFDGVEPGGFFTSSQLKEIEKVLFGKEVKDALLKQRKGS